MMSKLDMQKIYEKVLKEAAISTMTMWDIRNSDGSWRHLNIDPRDKEAKLKAINFVASHPGLSVGPNPNEGIGWK